MSEFTPIMTQEDFDKAIQKRLAQKEREMTEQFKEYMSPDDVKSLRADLDRKVEEANKAVKDIEDKLKAKDQTVAEITKRAETAEGNLLKNRIAYENKLPLELAGRLIGSTEEELKADAESLAGLMKPTSTAPLRTGDPRGGAATNNGDINVGLSQLLGQLNAGT